MPHLFEPDKTYEVSITGNISAKGRAEIARVVKGAHDVDLLWEDFGGFEMVNSKGKITKRIKSNLYNRLGLKLDPQALSIIGNIAYNNTVESGDYEVLISTNMDVWSRNGHRVSSAGNGTSCFQEGGEYHHCWRAMNEHGDYYAVIVSEDGEPPTARCWLQDEYDRLVLFNAYGLTLNRISIVLANALRLKTTQGSLSYSNGMYVNSDRVNVVSENPTYREGVEIMVGSEEYLVPCARCGYSIDTDGEDYYDDWGDLLCSECYSSCSGCSEFFNVDFLDSTQWAGGRYCEGCFDEYNIPKCEHCGTRFDEHEESAYIHSHNYWTHTVYCPDCASHCVVCDIAIPRGDNRCSSHLNVQPVLIEYEEVSDV